MSDRSTIEWTDATWNPVRGCTKISPGCANCYAETFAERFRGVPGHPYQQGFDLRLVPEKLAAPLEWTSPRRVFVNSMSDLLHEGVPDDYVSAVVEVMCKANWHTFQVLTKRPARLQKLLASKLAFSQSAKHVWWGVSVEDRRHGFPRIEHLRRSKASVRFLSIEPLIEDLGEIDLCGIDWVIVGGESGAGARPMKKRWVENIRDQCLISEVPFFFKQWGGVRKKESGRKLDNKTYDEFPRVKLRATCPSEEERKKEIDSIAATAYSLACDWSWEGVAMSESVVGPWAKDKLERLRKYLNAYTTIMRKQKWCEGYYYIDAFAGPGTHRVRSKKKTLSQVGQAVLELSESSKKDDEQKEFLAGSPQVALNIEHPFTGYVFVEKSPSRVAALEKLQKDFAGSRTIRIRKAECNRYLQEKIVNNSKVDWDRNRAVVFLDPFGMQVPWETLASLGRMGAIEVFLNFPVGMAIQRLLLRSGSFTARQRSRLDDYFGSDEWHEIVYEKKPNLFGEIDQAKVENSAKELLKWYRDRLKNEFGYVSKAALIRNSKGGHLYYLLLATPNKTAVRIADHILSAGEIV